MSRVLPSFINVNGGFGIPTLSSNSVTVTTTNVAFDFYNHRNIGRPFRVYLL